MKRDEMIGRAVHIRKHPYDYEWQDLTDRAREQLTAIGLAAVAEARRIDTCETCKHYSPGDEHDGYYRYCERYGDAAELIEGVGCNCHEPKE